MIKGAVDHDMGIPQVLAAFRGRQRTRSSSGEVAEVDECPVGKYGIE